MTEDVPSIGCRDECGARVPADEIQQKGWTFLMVQRRWRCPTCQRALDKANDAIDKAKQDGKLNLELALWMAVAAILAFFYTAALGYANVG